MVAIGFLVLWIGYQQAIYGWVLLKGWDIRWQDLANPLDPYQWPPRGTDPKKIPAGQFFPGTPPSGQQTTAAELARGRPAPGTTTTTT